MKNNFDTPICLFTWKRWETVAKILDVIIKVNPRKLYICSDGGRNEEEWKQVMFVRKQIDKISIPNCEIVKRYSKENIGVFESIGIGAKEILKREGKCIFLEDDNLPSESFFQYCQECLNLYENNEQIIMVCGTNYLPKGFKTNDSYMFAQALLPCGWASWYNKFSKYYDTKLDFFDLPSNRKLFLKKYKNRALGKQQLESIMNERNRFISGQKFSSWDFHLIASIMLNNLLVISPKFNQITNIGVDELGTHNVKNFKANVMTKRFCGVPNKSLSFPLCHPKEIKVNLKYQKICDRIILFPLSLRIKGFLVKIVKKIFIKK